MSRLRILSKIALTAILIGFLPASSLRAESLPSYDGFWGGFRNIPELAGDSVSFRVRRNNISKLGIVITGLCTSRETSEQTANTFVIGTSETPDFLLNRRRGVSTGEFQTEGLNELLVTVEFNLKRRRVVIAAVSSNPDNMSPCEAAATYRIRRGR